VKGAVERYLTHVGAAIERLNRLEGDGRARTAGPTQASRLEISGR
jgi:hypothetical protein